MTDYPQHDKPLRAAPESPLQRARRVVERELKDLPNNPNDVGWVHHNPVLWLRALNQARRDLDQQVHDDRGILNGLKPAPGVPASDIYLTAKAAHDKRHLALTRRRARIGALIEDAKLLLGDEPVVGHLIAGDMCSLMLEIAEKIAAGDVDSAKKQALWWADRFAEQEMYGTKAERDADLAEDAA